MFHSPLSSKFGASILELERMGIKILHLNIKHVLLGSFINQFVKRNQGFPLVIHANSAVKECAVVISFDKKWLHWSIDKIHSVQYQLLLRAPQHHRATKARLLAFSQSIASKREA